MSILTLPNETIYDIVLLASLDWVDTDGSTRGIRCIFEPKSSYLDSTRRSTVRAFCSTNRRLRGICLPIRFQRVTFGFDFAPSVLDFLHLREDTVVAQAAALVRERCAQLKHTLLSHTEAMHHLRSVALFLLL